MKLCYTNWSKENVSDESIRQDIQSMSKGLLELDGDYKFDMPVIVPNQQNFQPRKKFGDKRHKGKNRNFGGNKFKRRGR